MARHGHNSVCDSIDVGAIWSRNLDSSRILMNGPLEALGGTQRVEASMALAVARHQNDAQRQSHSMELDGYSADVTMADQDENGSQRANIGTIKMRQ